MRRKFALILCGIFFSVFIFIYFMLNHSISNNKNVSFEHFFQQLFTPNYQLWKCITLFLICLDVAGKQHQAICE